MLATRPGGSILAAAHRQSLVQIQLVVRATRSVSTWEGNGDIVIGGRGGRSRVVRGGHGG